MSRLKKREKQIKRGKNMAKMIDFELIAKNRA
jgi:hypothetical protein